MVKNLARRVRRRLRDSGVVAVEFALVLPLLLLLLLGGIDWGYFFFASEIVANAAREGARAGSVVRTATPSEACTTPTVGARAVALDYLQRGRLINNPADTRAVVICTTAVPGLTGAIQVTVRYTAKAGPPTSMSLTGFLPAALLPASASSISTMRLEP